MSKRHPEPAPYSAVLRLFLLALPAGGSFVVAYGLTTSWNAEPWNLTQSSTSNSTSRSKPENSRDHTGMINRDASLATIENSSKPRGEAPTGMVWIPGGEFSRGCDDPRSSICGGPDSAADARPIHRVDVDGFWKDRFVAQETSPRLATTSGSAARSDRRRGTTNPRNRWASVTTSQDRRPQSS